jgi:5-(carboxyamino)imidazole ribonucleotide synthase
MGLPLAPGATVGILGGGQLGRMLSIAAARFGFRTLILEPQPDCPASQVCGRQIIAAYDDAGALDELARACGVVTYEFENVPVGAAKLLNATVPVHPPPKALEVSQDRLVEKRFLNEAGLPTANFQPVNDDGELAAALGRFGTGVLKTRRFGYDGKGQQVLAAGGDASGACAAMGGVPLILESLVPFEREISVIAARGVDGSLVAYDPVENVHRDGILRTSSVPASVPPETAETARGIAFVILEALDYVGVVGVELFVLASGELLVNEIAPRVHNSGHWTEAACTVSQFEQHIRAIAGLPLGSTLRHFDCTMENLVGDEVELAGELLAEPDVVVVLYGKSETRPGRKMGHFTRLVRPAEPDLGQDRS